MSRHELMNPRSLPSALFSITNENMAVRKQYIRLGAEDERQLSALIPWIQGRAPAIAKEIYDQQFNFLPTLRFFEAHASRAGLPLSALRSRLETEVAKYVVGLFEGARTGWGAEYVETRLRIGLAHDRINLPFKWYIGLYAEHMRLMRRELSRKFLLNPWRAASVLESLQKVYNLDIQLVGDAFLLSTFTSTGFQLESIPVSGGADRTEVVGEIKSAFSQAISGLVVGAEELSRQIRVLEDVSQQLAASAEETSSQAAAVSGAAAELDTSIRDISRSATIAADRGESVNRGAKDTAAIMTELSQSSVQIGEMSASIAGIAAQTNLLALNATIEAARAGEAGKGFAVVASEVKGLAAQTAKSSEHISQLISKIQAQIERAFQLNQELTRAVSEINASQQSVASAVEEQSATSGQVTASVRDIAQASHGNAESTTRALSVIEALTQLNASIEQAVRGFRFHR